MYDLYLTYPSIPFSRVYKKTHKSRTAQRTSSDYRFHLFGADDSSSVFLHICKVMFQYELNTAISFQTYAKYKGRLVRRRTQNLHRLRCARMRYYDGYRNNFCTICQEFCKIGQRLSILPCDHGKLLIYDCNHLFSSIIIISFRIS
jgi:hypothetical protein